MDGVEGVGIRHEFPRLPLAQKTRALLAASRPFTIMPVFVGLCTAASMSVAYGFQTWATVFAGWRLIVDAGMALVLAQIGSNYVNQATDAPEDIVNRKFRPLPRGHVTADELSTLGHLAWFGAILRAATINATFGVLVALIIGISYAYSAPPLRLKRHMLWGNIGIAVARGVLGIVAAWSAFAPINHPAPWAAGLVLYVFLLGAATAKDFGDEIGDRLAGVQTLVVALGPKTAGLISAPFALSPVIMIPWMVSLGALEIDITAYLVVCVVLVWFAHSLLFRQTKQNKITEGTRTWYRMYVSLMALMVLFALA